MGCKTLQCKMHTVVVELAHFQEQFPPSPCAQTLACKVSARQVELISLQGPQQQRSHSLLTALAAWGVYAAGAQGHQCCQCHTHKQTSTGMQCPQTQDGCFSCQQLYLTERDTAQQASKLVGKQASELVGKQQPARDDLHSHTPPKSLSAQ